MIERQVSYTPVEYGFVPATTVRSDVASQPFLTGIAEGVFMVRRSRVTAELLPPNAVTDALGNSDLDWVPTQGIATIVSWAELPDTSSLPAALVALVELEEGPMWWTQIVGTRRTRDLRGVRVRMLAIESGPSAQNDARVPVFAFTDPPITHYTDESCTSDSDEIDGSDIEPM